MLLAFAAEWPDNPVLTITRYAALAVWAIYLLVFVVGAFVYPNRTPLDRVAGTYTVPK